MAETFETLMLIVFSLGWYCSIAKMTTTKRASGKSIVFVCTICFGFMCGVLAQLARFHETGALSFLVYVYAWNSLVCAFDGWLVVVLTRRERRLAEGLPPSGRRRPSSGAAMQCGSGV